MTKRQLGETGSGVDTARVLMLLSRQRRQQQRDEAGLARARVFECRTCGRRFPTFQALGGHRASHKRPRGDAPGDAGLCLGRQPSEKVREGGASSRTRAHGCPVCGVEFAVGQALGGHMRRHRDAAGAGPGPVVKVDVDVAGDECTGGVCLGLSLMPSDNCAKCRDAALPSAVQGVDRTMPSDCCLLPLSYH